MGILILKLALVLLLLVLAGRNLWQTWVDVRSLRWPECSARAIVSRVRETTLGGQRGFFGTHRWEVQYSYKVDGKSYTSPINTPFPNTTKLNAEQMAARVKPGAQFSIRYNPRNPQDTRMAVDVRAVWLQFGLRVLVYGLGIGYVIATF